MSNVFVILVPHAPSPTSTRPRDGCLPGQEGTQEEKPEPSPSPHSCPAAPVQGSPVLGLRLVATPSSLPPPSPQALSPSSAAPSSSADTASSVLGLPWPARGDLSRLGLALVPASLGNYGLVRPYREWAARGPNLLCPPLTPVRVMPKCQLGG